MTFDGVTYDESRDGDRLRAQYARVWAVMSDGEWHTPAELEQRTSDMWAAISARLRDFRKPKFGAHTVDREYVSDGVWRYRLTIRRELPAEVSSWQMTVQERLI